jgi:hypothetical protein
VGTRRGFSYLLIAMVLTLRGGTRRTLTRAMAASVSLLVACGCGSAGTARPKAAPHAAGAVVADLQSCNPTNQSMSALKMCASSKVRELEGVLTSTVSRAERYLPVPLVRRSQADFERYMASECLVAASVHYPGSEYPLLVSDCEIQSLKARINQVNYDMADAVHLRG